MLIRGWFGAVALLCAGWGGVAPALSETPPSEISLGRAPGKTQRTLVIVLDAVPFDTVDQILGDQPTLFEGFLPPLPVVSTFPSSTSVAMVGLLEPFDLERSPGYEARFFDWERRKVRGGGAVSFFRIEFAWREFFDWSRKGVVRSAFGGLRPVKVSGTRVEKAVRAFARAEQDPYFVYLETTDLAAHLKGPGELEPVFARLDAALDRLRAEHPDLSFRTVVFSDHGVDGDGTRLVNAFPAARRQLRETGFRVSKRLKRPEDVVLTPFGLVSSFEAYTEVENVEPAAVALVRAEGVDVCIYRRDESFVVENSDGRARVEGTSEDGWSYTPESSDPLGYAEVTKALEVGETQEAFSSESWFEATLDHHYPDALHRISRAFELVDNPASILCSLESGFMYGLTGTENLARLTGSTVRWTHGALFREATLGFLLTDDERFAGAEGLRFDQALLPLTEEPKSIPDSPDSDARAVAAASSGDGERDKMPGFERP